MDERCNDKNLKGGRLRRLPPDLEPVEFFQVYRIPGAFYSALVFSHLGYLQKQNLLS